MSGLTLRSPHCVSGTVVGGRVLGGQEAQLQGDWFLDVSLEMDTLLLRDGL